MKHKYSTFLHLILITSIISGLKVAADDTELTKDNQTIGSDLDQNTLELDEIILKTDVPDLVATISSTSTTSTTTTEPPPPNPEDLKISITSACFYSEAELCHLEYNSTKNCDCHLHPIYKRALYCCNVTDIEKTFSNCATNLTEIQHIHIRNATMDEIDFSDAKWKFFETIAITDGMVKRIPNDFYKFSQTKCLNVSNNQLYEINTRILKNLMNLETLDISHNNLSSIPNTNGSQKNLTLHIRENNVMLCKSVLEVLDRGGITFQEPEKTFCLSNQTFNWFNSTDVVPLRQLQRMKQLQRECPQFDEFRKCNCSAERIMYDLNEDHVILNARVDCSSLGLIELPDELPLDTVTLNISNNSITSLSKFSGDTYKHIQKLYADDNEITTLMDLESTEFIQKFDALFLRRNQLKNIPIYLLSHTLNRNPRGVLVYLEGNQLKCECNEAKVLKLWLLSQQSHIVDYTGILCESGQRVLDLSEAKLCTAQHDWTDYIYLIIITEVLLLIALICKVSYDYYIFKTHGFLPWPASMVPKIPFCDWLCET